MVPTVESTQIVLPTGSNEEITKTWLTHHTDQDSEVHGFFGKALLLI